MSCEKYDENQKVWYGKRHDSVYNPNTSVGYLILNVLERTPERIVQVSADTNAEITCKEMRLRTIKIAKFLARAGLKQGDVVGVMATNSENVAPVVFACLTLGLPLNFLAPIMTESDVSYMYGRTKPKLIFCDANIIETIEKSMKIIGSQVAVITLQDKVEGYQYVDDILSAGGDDTADFIFPDLVNISASTGIILCSSGTTALPKAVCKSHSQIIQQIFPMWSLNSSHQEVLFNFSTLYWATGFIFLINGVLYGCKRVITTKSFNPEFMVEIINRFKVTTALAPPSAVANLIQSKPLPMKSVKIFQLTGSVVSKSLCEALQAYIPNGSICPVYGTSEGDFLAVSFDTARYGSVGKASSNVQIKIIDENQKNLGPNEEGEICFKSAVTFSGYLDDPDKTKESVDNGWVYSGDIGYFDDDRFLFIVDRKKDMLKFNNYQVYPSELEAIINEIDGVIGSCVVGIFEENKGNDLIFAFVIKNSNKPELKEDDIVTYVNKKVIDAKKLRGGVHFVEEFPMTPSGKIQRRQVREMAKKIYDKRNR